MYEYMREVWVRLAVGHNPSPFVGTRPLVFVFVYVSIKYHFDEKHIGNWENTTMSVLITQLLPLN